MSKKTKKSQRRPGSASPSRPLSPESPGPYTLYRMANVSSRAREAFERQANQQLGALQARHRQEILQIRKIKSAEELVNSASQAIGVIGFAWHHKAREFGDEIVPLIGERLKSISGLADSQTRIRITEALIGELRWRGPAGAEVLLDRFDHLDYHSRTLACVALGLLEAQESVDKIWGFYEKVLPQKDKSYFIGALWGLIDLKDPRAADTLVYLVNKPRLFYELFGFLAIAGDEDAIFPLMRLAMRLDDEKKSEPMLALASIGYRIGREALVAMIDRVTTGDDDVETSSEQVADMILSYPPDLVQRYFSMFQVGLAEEEVTAAPEEEAIQEG